jgi:hypothetical protein
MDGPLSSRSTTILFWHNRCHRGPSTPTAEDRGVVDLYATIQQHELEIAVADREHQIPSDRPQDHPAVNYRPLKDRSCRSRAVCCCLTMSQLYLAGLAPTKLQQKLNHIACAPLMEESPKGGWSVEIAPQDSIHALIAVHTDEGVTECGSVFADVHLVQAALYVLEPLYLGRALEPERVSQKLHQNTFWMVVEGR